MNDNDAGYEMQDERDSTQPSIDDNEEYYIHFTTALTTATTTAFSTAIFSSEYNQATLFDGPRREPDRHEPPGSFGHVSHVAAVKMANESSEKFKHQTKDHKTFRRRRD